MKQTDLVQAAKNLNDVLGLNPPIDTALKVAELKNQIEEAHDLLEPGDVLSASTIAVLEEMGLNVPSISQDDGETEEQEEAEISLVDEVNNAFTLKDLKDIAKMYDEFKSIRGELTKYNDMDVLMPIMLDILEGTTVEDAEEVEETPNKAEPEEVTDEEEEIPAGEEAEEVEAEEMSDEVVEDVEDVRILVLRDNAKAELAQIKTLSEGIEYLHKVKSIETWIKAEKKDAELQNIIAEQKLRTQRILGELIREGQKSGELASKEVHGKGIQSSVLQEDTRKTLADIGITRNQSSIFQTIADIPEKDFETFIAEKKEAVDEAVSELTTKGAVAFAKKKVTPEKEAPAEVESTLTKRIKTDLDTLAGSINEAYDKEQKVYLIKLIK